MKVVFKIKEDDARNPGVIADCTGDNAGDSVGPTADGFETYGVTGVALISFIVLAVPEPLIQVNLLVWMFMIRVVMVIASGVSYLGTNASARHATVPPSACISRMPLTLLVWVTSIVSVVLTYILSYLLIPEPRRQSVVLVAAVDRDHMRHPGRGDHSGAGEGLHLNQVRRTSGKWSRRRRRVALR